MLTPDIGFLRITTFSQYTHDEWYAPSANSAGKGCAN